MELIARGSDFSGSFGFRSCCTYQLNPHESENRYLESGKEAT